MQLPKKYLMPVIIGLLVIAAAWSIYAFTQKAADNQGLPSSADPNLPPPVFMSSEEKQVRKLPEDSRIQVLGRDENGEITTYKIIRKDEDILPGGQVPAYQPQAR